MVLNLPSAIAFSYFRKKFSGIETSVGPARGNYVKPIVGNTEAPRFDIIGENVTRFIVETSLLQTDYIELWAPNCP